MSEGEIFLTMAACLVSIIIWYHWIHSLSYYALFRSVFSVRTPLLLAPFFAAGFLFLVLRFFSSSDVQTDTRYLTMYLALGMAWLALVRLLLPFLGLSDRDDVIERNNLAVSWAIAGALLGANFCFAGGNIGDGPGWWVVIFCAVLATVSILISWVILTLCTDIHDSLTIDRNIPAGIRTASYFISSGLILGRAVAGDWTSGLQTVSDFVLRGWPALLVLVAAIAVEGYLRKNESGRAGGLLQTVLPSALYLSIAAVTLWILGGWE